MRFQKIFLWISHICMFIYMIEYRSIWDNSLLSSQIPKIKDMIVIIHDIYFFWLPFKFIQIFQTKTGLKCFIKIIVFKGNFFSYFKKFYFLKTLYFFERRNKEFFIFSRFIRKSIISNGIGNVKVLRVHSFLVV